MNFRRFLPESVKPVARRVRNAVLGESARPYISHPEHVSGLLDVALSPTARLVIRTVDGKTDGAIALGKGVYIGRNVELAAPADGTLTIGRDTSIQDGCIVHGHVSIGAHCLFSLNIMVSSTLHRIRDRPAWLIRDQDKLAAQVVYRPADWSRPIVIDDDCWIGWGAVLMPGVHIGRGAVIGSNCVVTSDIGPYETHGGVPNRKIGERLKFAPPEVLSATNDEHIPYFYCGFHLSQVELANSRTMGTVHAADSAVIVLAARNKPKLILRGNRRTSEPLSLHLSINGSNAGIHVVGSESFELVVEIETVASTNSTPSILQGYTVVEIEALPPRDQASADAPRYELSYALLC